MSQKQITKWAYTQGVGYLLMVWISGGIDIIGIFLEVYLAQGFLPGYHTKVTEAQVAKVAKWILILNYTNVIKVKTVQLLSEVVAGKKNIK